MDKYTLSATQLAGIILAAIAIQIAEIPWDDKPAIVGTFVLTLGVINIVAFAIKFLLGRTPSKEGNK